MPVSELIAGNEHRALARTFWTRAALAAPWVAAAAAILLVAGAPIAAFLDVEPGVLWLVFGHFVATGHIPRFYENLIARGIDVDISIFSRGGPQ